MSKRTKIILKKKKNGNTEVKIQGEMENVHASLGMINHAIIQEYGMEQGTMMIETALDTAIVLNEFFGEVE